MLVIISQFDRIALLKRNTPTSENIMSLPAHLEAIVKKAEKKEAEFNKLGGNSKWFAEALEAAELKGDDNNLIHAVIPA